MCESVRVSVRVSDCVCMCVCTHQIHCSGFGRVFRHAVEHLEAARPDFFPALGAWITPISLLHNLRLDLIAQIEKSAESAARNAIASLFGANCFCDRDTRKLRSPSLGKWLSRLLDSVTGASEPIGALTCVSMCVYLPASFVRATTR